MESHSNSMMEDFNTIRQISYQKYAAFNKSLDNYQNYNIEIPNSTTATFKLGPCKFDILPVLRTAKNDKITEVTIFDRTHPTELNFLQIDQICNTMKIPKIINNDSEVFSFSYTLSAIICDKVGGATFLSATLDENSWIWFVVLDSSNSLGKKYLKNAEKAQKNIDDEEVKKWYNLMNI